MWWVVFIIIGAFVTLLIVLVSSISEILSKLFYDIKIFFGNTNRFNTLIVKLIGCFITIAIGCGVLFWLYSWELMKTVVQICMASIALLIAIMPIKNTFSYKRSFDEYSWGTIGCAITIAICSGVLLWLYSWEFLKTVIQVCVVIIVLLIIIMIIKGIFSDSQS